MKSFSVVLTTKTLEKTIYSNSEIENSFDKKNTFFTLSSYEKKQIFNEMN